MSVTLTQLLAQAANHLKFKDTTIYTDEQREDACVSAVKEYSRRRPNPILEAYAGIGDDPFYDLPTAWDESFSTIVEIEYKIEQTPKQIIADKYWSIDLMSGGKKLRFNASYPADDETFWIKYYGLHTFDSSGSSDISDADLTGLSYLATSIMCQELSTFFASKADPNLPNVEVVEFTSRVDEYNKKSSSWMKKYNETIKSDMNCTWASIDFIDNSYWNRNDQ